MRVCDKYEEIKHKWNGNTDSKSPYFSARQLGHSHEEAVIYAVEGSISIGVGGLSK